MTLALRVLSAVVAIATTAAGCGTPVEPAPLEWLDQASGSPAHFRGASAVSDSVAWASGRDAPGLLGLAVAPSGRVAWTVGARGRIMRVSGF